MAAVGNLPILGTVRDEDLTSCIDVARHLQTGRPRARIDHEAGVGTDTGRRSVGRSPNTPDQSSVDEQGLGQTQGVDPRVADRVPGFNGISETHAATAPPNPAEIGGTASCWRKLTTTGHTVRESPEGGTTEAPGERLITACATAD